ncbi:MAG: ABC transporter ATP-binding protein, partial [Bacteroidota bacterium]
MNILPTVEPVKNQDKTTGRVPVIEIEELEKSFGTQSVLINLNLKLYNGENLVVRGKSGSGKSVL